ncbi:MAG TPA: helix-turn-helix transcriptional regulator [Thermoleophilia bacterium]|nr:helix-turn-helix transcriptional regulator [Thermoleophilia bacterium]
MQTILKPTRPRYSRERFPVALKGLMEERHLSYRQLAYKTQLSAGYLNHLTKGTRPVPADPVIRTVATALCVEPDFFLEYRLRQVAEVLDQSTQLIDTLYSILLLHSPVSDDMKASLERSGNGNGGGRPLAAL